MRLFLFDIDGTLLSIADREFDVFGIALKRVYGVGRLNGYSFAGKTDHQIIFDLLSREGKSTAEIETGLPAMKDCYFDLLDSMLTESSMTVLPGVRDLLESLSEVPSVVLGIQTGNWRGAAGIKLSRYGLERYFEVGAFGDGQRTRDRLPLLALHRAEQATGEAIRAEQTVILGDTTLDIACARHCSMASVGVATGGASREQLQAAGADLVVASLEELTSRSLLDLAG